MRQITDPNEILSGRWPKVLASDRELLDYVKPIVSDVAKRGDQAVTEYTEKFDKVRLESFKITQKEILKAYKLVSQNEVQALRESRRRLELVESQRLIQNSFTKEIDGVVINCTLKPIQTVGCYVPGGKAAYPSSVIMNVTPAKVAGVERIVVCTPPGKTGSVDPLTLVACDVCMVDEIYKIGGVQAIAALAYGTETMPKVMKIVGPGNKYVTAAKTIVSDIVSIDKPAGPSEILILADETADPKLVAVDLISQAEHGPGGISGLVTTSKKLADEVSKIVEELVPSLERCAIIAEVLEQRGFIYIVESMEVAIEFANRFAPEHMEVLSDVPEEVADRLNNCGLVLLGPYSPVSSTDYCIGVNHVLPTEGYAKVSSGITVLDYTKPVSTVIASKTGLAAIRERVAALAEAEGLPNHKEAVEERFR